MKLKNILFMGVATAVLGVGVAVGAHQETKASVVSAATETTVYYAVPSDVVGSYTVKLNVNRKGDGDDWATYDMTKMQRDYGGYELYSCTYTDLYDGVGVMQFQLYEGGDHKGQQQPISSWTKVEKYNGKVYVHNDGWRSYAEGHDTYIPMRPSFFTNWTDAAGSIASVDARFWGENYSFEALSPFYRGETAEGWTGTLTSRTWKQSTQYVYFQLGGARDFDHGEDGHAHLVFHYGEYSADFYNNTFVENPMTLRYFKVPDDKFAELTAEDGEFDMYVEVVDPVGYGYGFVNLGHFHVNQTLSSTSDAMRYYLNNLSNDSREWEVNKRKEIFNTYFDNAAQREVFFASVSDISDSFSSNEEFLNHWYFDYNYFNNFYDVARHFDKAISTYSVRPGDTQMPFNNEGGYFRGWYENDNEGGFVASDALRYRFISRPFVLSGTGIITVKMAGKASLHVIDPTQKNTDTQGADLAWIDNQALQMDGNDWNMADSGFNTTAMVYHVINLEAYLGRTIQLAICDYDTSGWSACYFDELTVNYAARPEYHVDVAVQTNSAGTFYITYPDIYINSTCKGGGNQYGVIYNAGNSLNTDGEHRILDHVDESDSYAAHTVWKQYIESVRGGKLGSNVCDVLTSDEVKAFLNGYNALSEGAKQIVCFSDDFQRIGSGEWYNINPTIFDGHSNYNLGHTIQYLGELNHISVSAYNNSLAALLFDGAAGSNLYIIIIVGAAVTLTLMLFFVLKKKKQK